MKTLLLTLALAASALGAAAQTTTNIAYRITVETVVAGVTNSVNTNFRYDAGNNKDSFKINGYSFGYAQSRASGNTNDFGNWLKVDTGDRAKVYQDAKQVVDMQVTLSKVRDVSILYPDLLSQADITALNAIAAKAP